jgi:hypothetical protein
VEVLIKYTKFRKNGTLNLRDYLDNVFIENVDLWGFSTAYFPFLEILFNNYDKLNETEKSLFDVIKDLFVTLYTTRTEKLNLNQITVKLEKIDKLLSNISEPPSVTNNVGNGITKNKNSTNKTKTNYSKTKTNYSKTKTNKISKIKSSISFKRKTNKKRFKNPIFLSLK